MTSPGSATDRRPVDPVAKPFRGIHYAILLSMPFWGAVSVGIYLLVVHR